MLDIVLRVYGEAFDVDSFFDQYQNLVASDSYKKGEPDLLGNPSDFSGFDVIIAENETQQICLQKVQYFLEQYQQELHFLNINMVHCVLDIDATVKATDEMPTSLSLTSDLLGKLQKLNIAIEFSAYPHIAGL
jgi:hypothetical protein